MYGDMLLAAGQARLIHEQTGKSVTIGNPDSGNAKWFDLYDYIPYLSKSGGVWWKDHKGFRGYMSHYTTIPDGRMLQLFYNMDYRAAPARIEIDGDDNGYVIIEPSKKCGAPPAKLWHGYADVVRQFDCKFVQLNQDTLDVERCDTSLIDAARLMKGARAYIGTEGFLHHLAAAFGKPAVVVMGAFVPPTVLGYPGHINLCVDDPSEMGHCGQTGAMSRIPVDAVCVALDDALNGRINKNTVIQRRGNYVVQGFDVRYF